MESQLKPPTTTLNVGDQFDTMEEGRDRILRYMCDRGIPYSAHATNQTHSYYYCPLANPKSDSFESKDACSFKILLSASKKTGTYINKK